MKKIVLIVTLHLSIVSSCQTEKESSGKVNYLRSVGDIEQNDQIDKLNFKVCNGDDNILQYFSLGEGPIYEGEKSNILKIFRSKYKPIAGKNQNGLIRIRFIVNCDGTAGRFRVLQSNYNYEETKFDKEIVSQLLDITKGIENWKILYNNDIAVDYYMYLIFRIKDGRLT